MRSRVWPWAVLSIVALLSHLSLAEPALESEPFRLAQLVQTVVERCSNCDVEFGEDRRYRFSEQIQYCLGCFEGYPGCSHCFRRVDLKRGGSRQRDGRELCREHTVRGVRAPQTLSRVFQQAEREIARTFRDKLRLRTPVDSVRLVGPAELKAAQGAHGHGGAQGVTRITYMATEGLSRPIRFEVLLVDYVLPDELLTSVLHELGHVWHAQVNPAFNEGSPTFREGFAHWVAYRVHQTYRRQEAAAKLLRESTSPSYLPYQVGLQRFLALEERVGIQGVLDYAKKERDI